MVVSVIESTQHVYVQNESEFKTARANVKKVRLEVNEFTDFDNR